MVTLPLATLNNLFMVFVISSKVLVTRQICFHTSKTFIKFNYILLSAVKKQHIY